jgi:hypothetical protein
MISPLRGAKGAMLRPLVRCALLTSACMVLAAGSARAFEIPWPSIAASPNKPIYEQPRPAYDAIGIDLGPFMLKPSLSETVSYDDDIFASEIHQASDLVNTTGEEFKFASQWSRHSFSLDLESDQQVYTQHPEESANVYMGTMATHLDLGEDSYVEVDGVGGQKPQIRASADALQPFGKRPIYNVWGGNLTYFQRVGSLVNQFRAGINQNAYIYLQNIFQSNIDEIIGDRVSLDYGELFIPFVEVDYDQNLQYFHPELQNFQNLTGLVGVQSHIDDVLDLEVSGGFLRESYTNPFFQSLLKPVFYGKALWNVTPLTSLSANLTYDFSGIESFCNTGPECTIDSDGNKVPFTGALPPGTPAFETHRSTVEKQIALLSVEHEIWHDFLGTVGVGYQHYAYDLNGLTDNFYTIDGNVRYLVNNEIEVQANYEYRARSANQPLDFTFNSGPFKENTLSLRIVLQR